MEMKQKFMTRNDCYTANRKIVPKGIMVHSTATPGVMAEEWFSRWNKSYKAGEINRQVCVHAFVDDKELWQYLPWNHRGWHSGGAANNSYIGIEICEPAGFHYRGSVPVGYNVAAQEVYFRKAFANIVEACVYLCKLYGFTEKNIIDHTEGNRLGIASAHSDIGHWFSLHGMSIEDIRVAVKKALEPQPEPKPEPKPEPVVGKITVGSKVKVLRNAPTYSGGKVSSFVYDNVYVVDEITGDRAVLDRKGICTPFRVADLILVEESKPVEKPKAMFETISNLNLRTGTGTTNKIILTIPKGTIVPVYSEKDGWAYTNYKGNAGWVSSRYLKAIISTKKTSENLNLRTGNSTKHKIILTIPKGGQVTVYSVKDGWSNVSYKGTVGWVSNKYLV